MKFYTLWLSLVCILFFILQLVIPGFTDALVLNSAFPFEIWRYITSIFLHASLSHIVFNLFALILFGLILEKLNGSNKFLIVFFASGIIANIVSINFYSVSLGASGAIFGVIGALAFIKPLMTIWAFSLPMPMFVAAILWAIGDLIGIFVPSDTANIAHLSGIAVGLILGAIFGQKNKISYEYARRINIPEGYMQNWENRYM